MDVPTLLFLGQKLQYLKYSVRRSIAMLQNSTVLCGATNVLKLDGRKFAWLFWMKKFMMDNLFDIKSQIRPIS
jgi:hypothetical protein